MFRMFKHKFPNYRQIQFKQLFAIFATIIAFVSLILFIISYWYTSCCYLRLKPNGPNQHSKELPSFCMFKTWLGKSNNFNPIKPKTARYQEVCDNVNIPFSNNWYSVVDRDYLNTQTTVLPNGNNSFSNFDDLAYVHLPNYSPSSLWLNNISETLFLYSAFGRPIFTNDHPTETIENPYSITIVGIANRTLYCSTNDDRTDRTDLNFEAQMFCVFDQAVLRSVATVVCLPEHHQKTYTVVLVQCRTVNHYRTVRLESIPRVTKQEEDDQSTLTRSFSSLPIEIVYSSLNAKHRKEDLEKEITVCVRPLFENINILNLLEFIAYYQSNGVDNIVLYHYDFVHNQTLAQQSKTFDRVIQFFKLIAAIPGVRLNSFTLPGHIYSSIHSGAQLAVVNDCLYRYPDSVQIHVDIDEFISIANHAHKPQVLNLRQWIVQKWLNSTKSYVALYTPNVFHCHEFNIHRSNYYEFKLNMTTSNNRFYAKLNGKNIENVLLTRNNVYRQQTVWKPMFRSKVILLRPLLVEQMGIHNVWKFKSQAPNLLWYFLKKMVAKIFLIGERVDENIFLYKTLDQNEALLRHYRWCCDIEQTYFFDLFSFYTVNDQIMSDWDKNRVQTNQSITLPVESFVFKHFKRYISNMTFNSNQN